jgi:protein tyrosine phosphatase (PTP) superfamily phosphohydrolase (DUF442 family)
MTLGRHPNRRGKRTRLVLAVLTLLLPPATYVGYRSWIDNFAAVVPGRIYRSDQMTGSSIAKTVGTYGIRTVLNLRGPNPAQPWYLAERAATTGAGATQVDVPMSSCEWMSRAQLRALVRVLDSCDYPLLIHCQWGAERTGLVSAFSELLRPGATLADAEHQFSVRYLFLPIKDGKVMAEHLAQYETWLRAHEWEHSPERFRQWVAVGFIPLSPSREQWPYDPLPLVTVTRPMDNGEGEGITWAQPSPAPLAGSAAREKRR